MARKEDLTKYCGVVFGELTFIEEVDSHEYVDVKGKNQRIRMIKCLCSCGRIKNVSIKHLKSGLTLSCGCYSANLNSEKSFKRRRDKRLPKGYSRNCDQQCWQFHIWHSMIQRCYNKNDVGWKNYGGRGITVSESWLEPMGVGFNRFCKDMGDRPTPLHSIDRINNNEGYSKENCKWSTRVDQCINRRIFKNNTSGRTGVSWSKKRRLWCAFISVNKKCTIVGFFKEKEDAVLAREKAEIEVYGLVKE